MLVVETLDVLQRSLKQLNIENKKKEQERRDERSLLTLPIHLLIDATFPLKNQLDIFFIIDNITKHYNPTPFATSDQPHYQWVITKFNEQIIDPFEKKKNKRKSDDIINT